MNKSALIATPTSRTMVDVATYYPQTSTCSMCIGLRKFDECMTIASVLFSLRISPLSQSHVLTSLMHASIWIRAFVWSNGGKLTYNCVSWAYRWWSTSCRVNSLEAQCRRRRAPAQEPTAEVRPYMYDANHAYASPRMP